MIRRALFVGLLLVCLVALIPATRGSAAGDPTTPLIGIIATQTSPPLHGKIKITFTVKNFGRDFKGGESAHVEISYSPASFKPPEQTITALNRDRTTTINFADVPASFIDRLTIKVIVVHPCPNSGHPPCTNH